MEENRSLHAVSGGDLVSEILRVCNQVVSIVTSQTSENSATYIHHEGVFGGFFFFLKEFLKEPNQKMNFRRIKKSWKVWSQESKK